MSAETKLLEDAGRFLFGEEWRRPLARMLRDWRDRRGLGVPSDGPADDRYVRRAASGTRPIPRWWWNAIAYEIENEGSLARLEAKEATKLLAEIGPRESESVRSRR